MPDPCTSLPPSCDVFGKSRSFICKNLPTREDVGLESDGVAIDASIERSASGTRLTPSPLRPHSTMPDPCTSLPPSFAVLGKSLSFICANLTTREHVVLESGGVAMVDPPESSASGPRLTPPLLRAHSAMPRPCTTSEVSCS